MNSGKKQLPIVTILMCLMVLLLLPTGWVLFARNVSTYVTGGLPGNGNVSVRSNSLFVKITGGGSEPTKIETRDRVIVVTEDTITLDGVEVCDYDSEHRLHVDVSADGVDFRNDEKAHHAD